MKAKCYFISKSRWATNYMISMLVRNSASLCCYLLQDINSMISLKYSPFAAERAEVINK